MSKEIYETSHGIQEDYGSGLKRYDVSVDFIDDGYLFILDYGTYNSSTCSVLEDNTVFVDYGNYTITDNDELLRRKEDIMNEILVPLFGKEVKRLIETGIGNIPLAFKKAEEYIINNDMFVSNEIEQMRVKNESSLSNDYEYRTVYDEGLETVSFYIKSKLFDDEFGIIIYSDGSFYPVISARHLNKNLTEMAKKQRLEAIKKFIYDILKVKINFGTTDGVHDIRIKDLLEKAIEYARENGNIESTDEKGDIYTYKEVPSEVVSMHNIGKI